MKMQRDRNEPEIIKAFEERSCLVQKLAEATGAGVPDLLVGVAAGTFPYLRLCLVEVKDGALPPSKRKLNKAQSWWHAKWQLGHVYVAESVADVDVIIAKVRK